MYEMRWFIILGVIWLEQVTASELRCNYPLCATDSNDLSKAGKYNFTVEGHPIVISFTNIYYGDNTFTIECHGWPALNSAAIPSFTTKYAVSEVELISCPPPKRPLSQELDALNITILQHRSSSIALYHLPPKPALKKHHFKDLEHISELAITYIEPTTNHITDIVGAFKNLRNLRLGNVSLPITEYRRYKSTLHELILENTTVQPLRNVLDELSYLQRLGLTDVEIVNANLNNVESNNDPSKLQILVLKRWRELRIAPLEHCEKLAYLFLIQPRAEELPDSFIAACPKLETLVVNKAEYLARLPVRFLQGAIRLKYLNVTEGALEAIPAGLLEGAPNLRNVNLSYNRIRTIANDISPGPVLRYLSLAHNLLESEAVDALASMTSLTELDLGYNPTLTVVCDIYGYSKLVNLTQLQKLTLPNVAGVCRDWRDQPLVQVDLRGTRVNTQTVMELSEQLRDVTVNNATPLTVEDNHIQVVNLERK